MDKVNGRKNNRTIITIPDKLCREIRNVLSKEKPFKTLGRPVIPYRKVLDSFLYVLRTGCQWKMLPKDCGSGSTSVREDSKNGSVWMTLKRYGLYY